MRKNKKQSGFVLAYTIIIMSIILIVTAALITLAGINNRSNNILVDSYNQEFFINQQEYNFATLTYENYVSYLQSKSEQSVDQDDRVLYQFEEEYNVILFKDYSKIEIYKVENNKFIYSKER